MAPSALAEIFERSRDGFFVMRLDEPLDWDAIPDKAAAIDQVLRTCRFTHANEAMHRQYRAQGGFLIGRSARNFFEHDLDQAREVWRRFYDRRRLHVETHEQRLDGTTMWIEGDYLCLHDERGRITGHIGFQRDITDRRMAEHRLHLQNRTAEALNQLQDARAVFERTLDAILQVDDVDEAAVYLFDDSTGDLVLFATRSRDTSLMAARGHYAASSHWAALVRSGSASYTTNPATGLVPLPGDGASMGCIHIRSRSAEEISPMTRQCVGAIAATAGAAAMRATVLENEQRSRLDFASLFDALEDGLFVLDVEGRILYTNATVQKLLQMSADDLVGQPFSAVHPPVCAN
ncbi:MAG: PAS domain-containing protein, partial [Myxococcota bacterium]